MKSFALAFSLAFTLVVGVLFASAPAQAKTFDGLEVNVPAGWTEQPQEGGVVLVAPDGVSMVALSVGASEGMPAKDIAAATSKVFSGSEPVAEGKGYIFTCTPSPDIGEVRIYITAVKEKALLAILQGTHPDLLKVAKTAKPK